MQHIVVITDSSLDTSSASVENRNLEWNSEKGTNTILAAIKKAHGNVVHYSNLEAFLTNVELHRDDIVFPLLYGVNSPSSKGVIPATCEGYDTFLL